MLPRKIYLILLPLLYGAPACLPHIMNRPARSLSLLDPTPAPDTAPVENNHVDSDNSVDIDSGSVIPSASGSDSLALPTEVDSQNEDSVESFPYSASFTLVNFPRLLEDDIGDNEREEENAKGPEFEVSTTTPNPPTTSSTPEAVVGNPLSDLTPRQTNYLVAAGEKVEILSSQDAVVVDVLISAPPKPNARAANKLSKILSDSRNQNLILQNSQEGEFLEGKANEILRTYDKSYNILQTIFSQISAARQYFIGRIPPPSVTDGCAIAVPWTEAQDEIS